MDNLTRANDMELEAIRLNEEAALVRSYVATKTFIPAVEKYLAVLREHSVTSLEEEAASREMVSARSKALYESGLHGNCGLTSVSDIQRIRQDRESYAKAEEARRIDQELSGAKSASLI